MKSFILMLTFLTRIPFPVNFEFRDEDFARGLWFLPVIGLIIGIPIWLVATFVSIGDYMVASFVYLLIYLMMTGGLHLDGLADYCDGVFSGRTKERILEIMKDVHLGTFGGVGLIVYFLGMFALLGQVSPVGLLLMPVVGKCMGFILCSIGVYPREKGMGMPLINYGKPWFAVVVSGVLLGVLGVLGLEYLGCGFVTILFTIGFNLRNKQLIGGITGDVIGAGIEISQVLWLLSLVLVGGVL